MHSRDSLMIWETNVYTGHWVWVLMVAKLNAIKQMNCKVNMTKYDTACRYWNLHDTVSVFKFAYLTRQMYNTSNKANQVQHCVLGIELVIKHCYDFGRKHL